MTKLTEMSYREMVKRGKELGIEGCHVMKKAALLEALGGLPATDGGQAGAPKSKKQYITPGAIRCPRCGASDTVATSTKGRIQYRKCLRAVCRYNFSVTRERR